MQLNLTRGLFTGLVGALIGLPLRRPGLGFALGFLFGAMVSRNFSIGFLLRLGFLSFLLVGLFFALPIIGLLSLVVVPLFLIMGTAMIGYFLLSNQSGFEFDWASGSLFGTAPQKAILGLMAELVDRSKGNKKQQFELVRRYINRIAAGNRAQSLWNRFLRYREEEYDPEQLADEIRDNTSDDQRQYLIQVMVSLVLVSEVNEDVRDFLHRIADWFDRPKQEVDRLLNMGQSRGTRRNSRRRRRRNNRGQSRNRGRSRRHDAGGLREAYETLGVDPSASKEEVKKAYQEKVKKYHPDQHRSDNDSNYEEAEEKMAKVNKAYQRIKEHW